MKEVLAVPAIIHELQGYVSAVSMFSCDLGRLISCGDEVRIVERAGRIHRAASQLQRVLDALTAIVSDETPLRSRVDLSALAAEIVRTQVDRTPAYARAEIRIQCAIVLEADPQEMHIALENLIGNALKFSANSPCPQIRITSSVDSGRHVVNVVDNGVGIAPEDTSRIFEIFTRVHPRFSGSGVGLAIVRRIVERHGGAIWAKGEPGAGTIVSFYLGDGPSP